MRRNRGDYARVPNNHLRTRLRMRSRIRRSARPHIVGAQAYRTPRAQKRREIAGVYPR